MSYATPADLMARFDARTLGQLVRDDSRQATETELRESIVVQAALDDASGEIDAALIVGGRYKPSQLAELTGNAKSYLVRIACWIAMRHLWGRRPYLEDPAKDEAENQARKALASLRKGEAIFILDEDDAVTNSMPALIADTPRSVRAQNLTVDHARGSFFPRKRFANEG
jgi:phage gp36-like protein